MDWEAGLERHHERFCKGLATHFTEMDFERRTLAIRIRCPVTPAEVYGVMRDVFCGLGGMSGDVLLHGATVIHRQKAMIFCAESGGGKSTLARLLAPVVEVMNDEIVWVRQNKAGRWCAVNQGFWGIPVSSAPADVPVGAVYLIEKADACWISEVPADSGFPRLLTAPFGGQDPLLPTRAAQTARFLESVPLHRLHFARDAAALQALLLGADAQFGD